jgi:Leu/Phe-tRNA-protein transferase
MLKGGVEGVGAGEIFAGEGKTSLNAEAAISIHEYVAHDMIRQGIVFTGISFYDS